MKTGLLAFLQFSVTFLTLLNRVNFLSKYAKKGQPKYVQLVMAAITEAGVVVVVAAVVVAVILSVDQNKIGNVSVTNMLRRFVLNYIETGFE